jgi:hypothetical protein
MIRDLTNHKLFQGLFEKLIVDTDAAGMFDWGERVLDNCISSQKPPIHN